MDHKKSNTRLTVIGLLLALLLAALDQTIVSTAMPTIIEKLGGLDKFVWVFSAYLIANVTGIPIFGKLSDMYGRKRFFIFGLIIFMVGSALCGTSQTMTQLIIYRAIQGIGGGALMPIIFTIIFDIFPPEKRGKMQGLFGAVFGVSSVLGPLAGSFFTDYANWQWIFYVNLPLGIISFILIMVAYHESLEHRKQTIDWLGTVLMVGSVLCLMFGLELGGKTVGGQLLEWGSWQIVSLFIGFAILLIVFLMSQKTAKDPIIPLGLFRNRLFTSSMVVSFMYGAVMILGASYIPLYVQGVFNVNATGAGLVLTPMMLGVVASSAIGGRFVAKTSYRNIMLVSAALIIVAVALLGTISINSNRGVVTVYMIILGLGMGASFPIISMSSLHGISFQQRGTVNSLVAFFRTIGSAIGVTVFGTIQSRHLQNSLSGLVTDSKWSQQIGDGRALLQKEVKAHIPPDILHKLLGALADSVAFIFQWSVLAGIIAFAFILMMGKARLEIPSGVKEKA
jgi:EmrB/QacA subfamily drug resistance transporter